jgi:hypothetical protein
MLQISQKLDLKKGYFSLFTFFGFFTYLCLIMTYISGSQRGLYRPPVGGELVLGG